MAINLQNAEKQSTLHEAGDRLGTYYLADNPKYFEVQRTNNFVFYVSGLKEKGLKIPQNIYAQNNIEDVIKVSVNKSFVPQFTMTTITVNRGNNTMKFAGKPEFGSGSIELVDYIGAGTYDALLAWKNQAYDPETEKVGLVTDYKCDAYLLEYTPDYQLVRTWKLLGCWCTSVSKGDYSHDSNEKQMITANIEYDKAWVDTTDID